MILVACAASVSARPDDTLWYRSLGVEEGLSQNFVTAMAADADGFMWFGTGSGLNRWNGYEFESYRHDPDDPASLSASTILTLYAGDTGTLWVGTPMGLDQFEPASNTFRHYGALFRTADGRAVPAETVASDRAGRAWFAWHGGPRLYMVNPRTGQRREYSIGGTDGQQVTTVYVDSQDRLWVAMQPAGGVPSAQGVGYQLLVFDRCSDIGERLPAPRTPLAMDAAGEQIVTILEDRAHRLWFARRAGGLLRYDPGTGAVDHVVVDPTGREGLTGAEVRSLVLGPSGEIWALAYSRIPETADLPSGLHRVDPDTLAARPVDLRERDARPGSEAQLERLAVDRSGVLWLASNAGGLRYADVSSRGPALYRKEVIGPPGLNSSFVRAVTLDRQGILWVGTPRGLNRIDRRTGTVRQSGSTSASLVALTDPNVQALQEDRDGNLWIGTPLGLVVMEPSGAVRRYRHRDGDPNSLSVDYVQVIHEGDDGRLWIGTLGGGLNEFDRRARAFRRYPGSRGGPDVAPGPVVNALLANGQNDLWIGTAAGLARLDTSAGSTGECEPVASSALGDVRILSLGESSATPGALWIGTDQHGLCRLDVRHQTVQWHTSRNSGLADDTVYGILTDDHGRLWLSTNRGLIRFDPVAGTFRTYDAGGSLQSREFNARAFFEAPDGEMFFGGVAGLNAFYPDRLADNPYAPRVLVTAVRTSDRDAARHQPGDTAIYRHGMQRRVAEVGYGQRDVTFDYVALHNSDAARNQYFYRLDTYDTDWLGPVAARRARYTNLRPGSYTFRVKALSSHGVWSRDEAVFSFVVLPPFYQTAWFRALAGLGILVALVGAYRLRVRRLHRRQVDLQRQVARRTAELRTAAETLERQAQQLQELDSAKSRFFANVSHEFRTPLTLTLGPLRAIRSGLHGEIPREASEEIELAIRNTERQLALVDQLMELARLDAGQLQFKPRPSRLDECVRMAAAHYESLAKRQCIRYAVELPGRAVAGMFDEEKLDRVLGNLLDNAFKFTPPGGAVTVKLTESPEGWATVEVDDTGPGIPADDLPHVFERFYRGGREAGGLPGTGIGLALARECVELHGGQIRAENRPDGGTRFIVGLKTTPAGADVDGASDDGVAVASASATPDPNVGSIGNLAQPVPASGGDAAGARDDSTAVGPASADAAEAGLATILIVDDHADMRAYLRKQLAPHYRVLEAAQGGEGLEKVRAELPDAIVCDVMMPGIDGYAFCRAIKADPDTDFLPVILLTARAGPEGRIEGLEGGADDYITKPFEPAELLVRIRNLLRSRERLKARFAQTPAGHALLAIPRPTPSADAVLLDRLRGALDQAAHDEAFDVPALAAAMGMSRAQLHRRLKEAFDSTPAELIIRYRLERAAQMLAERAGNVGEVAYAVGFKNVSHFVKRFRTHYGQTPAAYAARPLGGTQPPVA